MTTKILTITLRFALCALLLQLLPNWELNAIAQKSALVQLYDYKVKTGDTCVGIATRELGARKAYKTIHEHNKLGPTPHHLRPGQILRLPKRVRSPDAKIASAVGDVQFRKATEPSWAPAELGLDLYRAWRVWSQEKANALVTFKDNSSVAMRSDTILVIYGPSGSKSQKRVVRADLESGSLRTRLASLESRLVVTTDASSIELGGGSSVISTTRENKRTTLSNHEGRPALVRSRTSAKKKRKKGSQVAVSPGKGTWLRVGQNPAPPIDLPSAPSLKISSSLAIGLAHRGVTIAGSFSPVSRAEKYRVEIAIDPLVRIVISAFELPKGVTSFSALGLPPGDYYLSVAAVDVNGLESIPSKRQRVAALTIQQKTPDGTLIPSRTPDMAVDSDLTPPVIALGSLLEFPPGLECSVDGEAISDTKLGIRHSGKLKLTCIKEGQSSLMIVDVPQSSIAIAPSSTFREGIPRDTRVVLQLKSATPLPPKAALRIEGSAGVEAHIVSVDNQQIDVSLLATHWAGAGTTLKIVQATTAGDIQLASVAIVLLKNSPKIPSSQPHPLADPLLYLAPMLGYQSATFESDPGVSASLVGIRTKLKLGKGISLELDSLLGLEWSTNRTIANNTLFAAWQTKALNSWRLHSRLGVALWHNTEKQSPTNGTLVGAALGLGTSYQLSSGALRLDLTGYVKASASGRISSTLSYEFPIQ